MQLLWSSSRSGSTYCLCTHLPANSWPPQQEAPLPLIPHPSLCSQYIQISAEAEFCHNTTSLSIHGTLTNSVGLQQKSTPWLKFLLDNSYRSTSVDPKYLAYLAKPWRLDWEILSSVLVYWEVILSWPQLLILRDFLAHPPQVGRNVNSP